MAKPIKLPQQSEAELTRSIRGILKVLGIVHWKVYQTLGSVKGIPDIVGCKDGRMIAIEVKTATGKVSPEQQQWIDRINRAGGLAFCARSTDDVIEKLGVQDRFLFGGTKTTKAKDW